MPSKRGQLVIVVTNNTTFPCGKSYKCTSEKQIKMYMRLHEKICDECRGKPYVLPPDTVSASYNDLRKLKKEGEYNFKADARCFS